jgi:hypothetical protein
MSEAVAVVLVIVVAVLIFHSLLLIGVIRRLAELTRLANNQGPQPQGHVGRLQLASIDGRTVDTREFGEAGYGILFVSTTCSTCHLTLEEVRAVLSKTGGRLIVACQGFQDECRDLATAHEIWVPIVEDADKRLMTMFGVTEVPTAVLVDGRGDITSKGHPVREDLESLRPAGTPVDAEMLAGSA